MKLTITESAEQQLKRKAPHDDAALKLKYETEGCGCVMSGIPKLEWIEESDIEDGDIKLETGSIPVWMEQSKLIFFDEDLKIDFSEERQLFRLSSPNQILNGQMGCTIKR